MIETNLALICACLPGCKLPLAYLFPAQFSSSAATTEPRAPALDEEKAAPAAPRARPASRPLSRPPAVSKKVGKSPLSRSAVWEEDEKGLGDLAPPPTINPDRTHRRSSMFRDAYVWLNTMV